MNGPITASATIVAARAWAAIRFPYLASALFSFVLIERHGSGAVTADARGRVYIDPELVDRWSPAEFGSVLVHHVSHLIREHAERATLAGVDDDTRTAWTSAADAEINDDLLAGGAELPGHPILPEDLGHPRHRTAESYFRGTRNAVASIDCGSVADGVDRPAESDPLFPVGLDAESLRRLRARVTDDCRRLAGEPGTVPEGWQRWARARDGPTLPWRTVLRAELRRHAHAVAGAGDYSYRRPSRRSGSVENVVLPHLLGHHPEIVGLLDTSGSMTDAALDAAVSELHAISRELGVPPSRMRLIACDTAPRIVTGWRRGRDLSLAGGGGTDLRTGIEAACGGRPRPDIVVVLTDGLTAWPDEPIGPRLVIVLLSEEAPPTPAWATTVHARAHW